MPRLVFIGGHFAGQTVELDTGRTMVGRGHWNGLVIADKTVSNYHCDLLDHGREVIVREKGSTNGTWVDDQRVTGQLPVKPGQIVHFGSACAQLTFDGSERLYDESEPETAHDEYRRIQRERQASAGQFVVPQTRTMPEEEQTMPSSYRPVPPLSQGAAPSLAERQSPKSPLVSQPESVPALVGTVVLALGRLGTRLAGARS